MPRGNSLTAAQIVAGGETLHEFFTERADYLRMYAVEVTHPAGGSPGADLVLRLDGTYYGELATAAEIEGQLHYERNRLLRAMTVSGIPAGDIEVGGREWLGRKISQFRRDVDGGESLAWTAGELVSSGQCTGGCLVAATGVDDCDCRCRGDWHGALANVTVQAPMDSNQ